MTPRAASASHRHAGSLAGAGALRIGQLCFGQLCFGQICFGQIRVESFSNEPVRLDYAPP